MVASGFSENAIGVVLHQAELVPELPEEPLVAAWIQGILRQESKKLHRLHFVFLDDPSLLKINQDHLGHDTFTDILTFPYNTNPVDAEIYMSMDRVRENAKTFDVPVLKELMRVMAHGVLHLCGWNDKTEAEALLMRKREDACLGLFKKSYSAVSSV